MVTQTQHGSLNNLPTLVPTLFPARTVGRDVVDKIDSRTEKRLVGRKNYKMCKKRKTEWPAINVWVYKTNYYKSYNKVDQNSDIKYVE